MHERTIKILSNKSNKSNSSLLFDVTGSHAVSKVQNENIVRDFMDKEYYPKEWDGYLDKNTERILEVVKNWNDIDFFEDKFDELKEKEMAGELTNFEKKLLYEIIDSRLLDFPKGPENPFFPNDYEQLMVTKNEYKSVVNKFNKKYKTR